MKQPKNSKTLWFALALAALTPIEAQFRVLQDLLGDWYPIVYLIIASVVSVLRLVTTQPILWRDEE